MWTYIHTPGIHTNANTICANYTVVSKTNKQTTARRKSIKNKNKGKHFKQSYKHTFTTATKTEKVNRSVSMSVYI